MGGGAKKFEMAGLACFGLVRRPSNLLRALSHVRVFQEQSDVCASLRESLGSMTFVPKTLKDSSVDQLS